MTVLFLVWVLWVYLPETPEWGVPYVYFKETGAVWFSVFSVNKENELINLKICFCM